MYGTQSSSQHSTEGCQPIGLNMAQIHRGIAARTRAEARALDYRDYHALKSYASKRLSWQTKWDWAKELVLKDSPAEERARTEHALCIHEIQGRFMVARSHTVWLRDLQFLDDLGRQKIAVTAQARDGRLSSLIDLWRGNR